jgi:zinc transporter ZupT
LFGLIAAFLIQLLESTFATQLGSKKNTSDTVQLDTHEPFSGVVVSSTADPANEPPHFLPSLQQDPTVNLHNGSQYSSETAQTESPLSKTKETKSLQIQVQQVPTYSNKKLSVIILESGILFHSVIIGLTLGITPDDEFTTLLIAISFHQFFEGMALGTLIGELGLTVRVKALLTMMYPVTTPLGMAIGMAVRTSLDVNSGSYVLTLGIFESLS